MGVVDKARQVAEDVAEATGTEKTVDKIEDEIQKRTGVDLGGSGGGKNDPDVKKQGEEDRGVSDKDGGTGGTSSSGRSAFEDSSGDTPTTGQDVSGENDSGGKGSGTGGTPEATDTETQKQTAEKVRDALTPDSDQENLREAKEFAKKSGLANIQNEERLEQELVMKRPFQTPGQRERTEAFIQNVQAEEKAKQQKQKIQEQIQELQSGPSKEDVVGDLESRKENLLEKSGETGKVYNLTPINRKISELKSGKGLYTIQGPEGKTTRVSRDQAISRLKDQKSELSSVVSEAKQNQKNLLDPPEFETLELQEKGEVGPEFSSSPTDSESRNQFASGTRIPGGFSKSSPLSDPDTRRLVKQNLETRGDVATLALTRTGFEAPFAAVDPDNTVEGIIEEDQRQAMERGNIGNAVEFLGSPGGLAATGGLGKAVGAGVKGLQASGVGTGQVASALGTGAKVGGAGLVGLQAGKGARNIAEGRLTKGGGQLLQVTAETGAFVKGLRQASRKYGPRLARTTEVEQDNFLRQIQKADDESFLVGSGEMTATTRVLQDNPFKPRQADQVVDEVTSKANYRLVADRQGAEAQGSVIDNLPTGESTEKQFQSLSTVVAREGDKVQIGNSLQELGDQEVATRNILRTQRESRAFRYSEDTTRTTVTRKETEAPVDEIRSFQFREADENVVENIQQDVAAQVRKDNLDAKRVQLSSYTNDGQGEVFSKTSNLVLNKRSGGRGAGSFGSGGQGLEYQSRYSDGFVQESQRQVRAGEQFGARSREVAQEQLESGSQLQGFSSGGGSGGGRGAQADLGREFQVQDSRGQAEVQTVESGGQNLRVSRTRTGERLRTEIGSSVQAGSGLQNQGDRPGLRRKQRGETRNIGVNDIRRGLGEKVETGQKVGQVQDRGLRNLNQVRQTTNAQTGQISTSRLGTLTIPQLKARAKVSAVPELKTSTVTTPAVTATGGAGGVGILTLDLEASGVRGSTKGEGNIGLPGEVERDVNVSLLSANRAELLTGKKTLDTDSVSSFSQSPFSGGVQTVEEQNLGKRKFKSDKEVEFY